MRENHADDKQVRNLVVREQPPSRQYGTESLSHPLIIPLRPAKHAFEIRYHASATLPADATDEFVLLLFKGEEEARSVWGAGYEKPML